MVPRSTRVLTSQHRRVIESPESGDFAVRAAGIRWSEWLVWAFLVYAAVSALFTPLPPNIRIRIVPLNLMILAAYAIFACQKQSNRTAEIVRDWLPLLLTILAYQEMGWFAMPHAVHSLEDGWVTWDRVVLLRARPAIEFMGPVIPGILEIAYSLVWAIAPFSLVMLYAYGHRDRVDRFLFLFLTGVLFCYALFPFFPSEPPRVLFPTSDLPAYQTIFRRWNLWVLGVGGIHTSVFPSAHVAGGFSAAAGMWLQLPEHRWVSGCLLLLAVLIATATVYGRYHYLADVLAGMLMTAVAIAVTCFLRAAAK